MSRSLILLFLLPLSLSVFAAEQEFVGIETLMTTEEMRAAGIDALSRQQLDALNRWLQNYQNETSAATSPRQATTSTTASVPPVVTPAPPPKVDDNFGQPPPKVDIVSRIDGRFEGWTGRTRFTLENGQVWEQRRGNRWKISLDRPEVKISENFLGAYEMEVVSEGRSIGVRRIR